VNALKPNQRPQTIQSVIGGRIEKWFVQEGQFVKKGDTILFLSETKNEYLDPNLVSNTGDQIKSKEFSVQSYMNKVNANDQQIDALINTRKFKLEQTNNKLIQAHFKVQMDSIELVAAILNAKVASDQLTRMETLFKDGLKSLTELETRKLKLQETQAKVLSQKNKLLSSRNELINVQIELQGIRAEFSDKLAKAESEKFSILSNMYDAEASVTKLQNQLANYSIRSGMYYVLAPQDGYITKAIQSGIGETIKEGSEIISIMPAEYELAVEMYVQPMDIPLLHKQQHVQIQFDGWPSIIFSGWPGASFGTYGGEIVAIDNFISKNGKYRVLVAQDKNHPKWPAAIKLGAGANTITLLKEVPIWYELWRQINGFPPDFYVEKNSTKSSKEKK
jgi:multidrug efflux pump subunit AcrA (membrane-fusion protein)